MHRAFDPSHTLQHAFHNAIMRAIFPPQKRDSVVFVLSVADKYTLATVVTFATL